ncbi:uncharacterized protein [Montipora capricornis]|uniref:uncharacterized protein n=1 Tax=Montipora capricornis TaxID=246305 RepID=UPI0035F150C7
MAAKSLRIAFQATNSGSQLHDLNSTTAFASQVITASFSVLCYVLVLVFIVLGVCLKSVSKLFSSPAIYIFFLVGGIITTVNVLNTWHGNLDVMCYHRIISVFLVGVVLALLGAVLFFEKPRSSTDQHTLGQHQPSMGLLLTIITLPLCATELLILIQDNESRKKIKGISWRLLVVNESVFIVQKVIQVTVYVWLRDFKVREAFKENASFYFMVLAFYNFVDWVDSQVNLESGVDMEGTKEFYGQWFGFLFKLYEALLIDYRLLCSLLFLEHSFQVQHETENVDRLDEKESEIERSFMSVDRLNRNIGFIVGFSCLLVPFICALFYVHKLHLTVYTRAVATFLGSLTILASGVVLLLRNSFDYDKRDKESMGVKIMVCFFGATGFSSLMIKAALAEYWALGTNAHHSYQWAGAELIMRGLTTLFLMYLFLKLNPRALPRRNPEVRVNHFLVPVLMFGIIADFAACLVDQQIGPLDPYFRMKMKDAQRSSVLYLHDVGSTMHLGFLIHVGLTFLIMQTRFGRRTLTSSWERLRLSL